MKTISAAAHGHGSGIIVDRGRSRYGKNEKKGPQEK